jgi:alpha-mannosidase
MRGSVAEIYREAELFNQKPYAVNVFPTGKENKKFATVSLDGKVVLTNCHQNEKGEYIVRLYNPAESTENFRLQIGEACVEGVASKGEVVSVVVYNGEGKVIHDKMPV